MNAARFRGQRAWLVRSVLTLALGALFPSLLAGLGSAAELPPPGTPIELPPVDVYGARLTLAELIDRADRAVEESQKLDVPHRYTEQVRFVASWDDSGKVGRRRDAFEEISRVEVLRGRQTRSIRLETHQETWRGDSLVSNKVDEKVRVQVRAQIEDLEGLPFSVRGGDYRYRILERRPLGDRALLRVAYSPIGDFTAVPEGEVWLDSHNYIVLLQTGDMHKNLFMPMMIKDVDWFWIRREAYGPIWLVKEFALSIRLRHLGIGAPSRVEARIRIYDVSVGDSTAGGILPGEKEPGKAAIRTARAETPGDHRVRAVLDSVMQAAQARADPLLNRGFSGDLARVASRGDSLLAAGPGPGRLRLESWHPVVRYNRTERLMTGLEGTFRYRTPINRITAGAGYAFGLARALGHAGVELAPDERGQTWHWGLGVSVRDEVSTFGAQPQLLGALFTFVGYHDPVDYYRNRQIELEPSIRRRQSFQLELPFRFGEDLTLPAGSLWTVQGISRGKPLLPIDPGRIRAGGLQLQAGGSEWPLGLTIKARTEFSGRRFGADLVYREGDCELGFQPTLPGARRLDLRIQGFAGSAGLPRQRFLYLGGPGTLRAYRQQTLAGRSGYHIGGEFYLNRDIVGWLPFVPDRGLGLEAFLAGDFGQVAGSPQVDGATASGSPARASVGVGCWKAMLLPGIQRVSLSLHTGVGTADRPWTVRLEASNQAR